LIGVRNGVNLEFTTPEVFLYQAGTGLVLSFWRNGQKLIEGLSDDYTVSESGGPGSGYDTVTLTGYPPISVEKLIVSYYAA
jgi:hypothetical protein